jgi:hypothetical protein
VACFCCLRPRIFQKLSSPGASAMLLFLARGDLLCRPRKLETLASCGARPGRAGARAAKHVRTGRDGSGRVGTGRERRGGARSRARAAVARAPASVRGPPPLKSRSVGKTARIRALGGSETRTYQCEVVPEFSSAGFRKTFWRLLDILEGWEGTAQMGTEVPNGARTKTKGRWVAVTPQRLQGAR